MSAFGGPKFRSGKARGDSPSPQSGSAGFETRRGGAMVLGMEVIATSRTSAESELLGLAAQP